MHIQRAFEFVLRHCPDAVLDDWSDDQGDDVHAVRTHNHVLWIQNLQDGRGAQWRIQEISYYSDHTVGIVNDIEPGDVILATADPYAALQVFVMHSVSSALNERLSGLAEAEFYAKQTLDPPPDAPPLDRQPYRNWLRDELDATDPAATRAPIALVDKITLVFADGVSEETRNGFIADLRHLLSRVTSA